MECYCSSLLVRLFLTILFITQKCYGMCPFAKMLDNYNFTGDWTMTDDDGTQYSFKFCHQIGTEAFFGISYLDTPDWLIGFGGGNWSQWNMGIGGIRYILKGNKIDESGFIITMDTESHGHGMGQQQWVFKDNNRSGSQIDQINSNEYSNHECALPFGFDKRIEKYSKIKFVKRKKRKIPREIEKKKKMIVKLENRNDNGEKDERIAQIKEEIKELELKPEEPITDNENPDLVIIPTLYDKTFINDQLKVTFIDNETMCIQNITTNQDYRLTNISSWYDGVAYHSHWETQDASKLGSIFFIQLENDKILSSIGYESDGNKLSGYSSYLSETTNDMALECIKQSQNTCDNGDGQHCEL